MRKFKEKKDRKANYRKLGIFSFLVLFIAITSLLWVKLDSFLAAKESKPAMDSGFVEQNSLAAVNIEKVSKNPDQKFIEELVAFAKTEKLPENVFDSLKLDSVTYSEGFRLDYHFDHQVIAKVNTSEKEELVSMIYSKLEDNQDIVCLDRGRSKFLNGGAELVFNFYTKNQDFIARFHLKDFCQGILKLKPEGDFAETKAESEYHQILSLATGGNAVAQYQLGKMYHKPINVERNLSKAFTWYQESANQGYAPAQASLGVFYGTGAVGDPDYAMCYYWLELASIQENSDSFIIARDACKSQLNQHQLSEVSKKIYQ